MARGVETAGLCCWPKARELPTLQLEPGKCFSEKCRFLQEHVLVLGGIFSLTWVSVVSSSVLGTLADPQSCLLPLGATLKYEPLYKMIAFSKKLLKLWKIYCNLDASIQISCRFELGRDSKDLGNSLRIGPAELHSANMVLPWEAGPVLLYQGLIGPLPLGFCPPRGYLPSEQKY